MLAPLSWLKDYVNTTTEPNKLGDRLTEIGLGTEKITKVDSDTLLELEITPNRPDLLSIIGVAREIAAIEKKKITFPKTFDLTKTKPSKKLPLTIKTDTDINPRFTGIIIDNITVKPSPKWLQERLEEINQRPINNIVDITNYVMFELGNPIHAFDYHKIKGQTMRVAKAKGGESFKSVDGVSYYLPKDAVIISDEANVIDLCGIKGGYNSGTFEQTRTIFLRVPVEVPVLIRKASQALGLRSDASSIFERGVNAGGTLDALARAVYLIFDLAGGEIASDVFDIKEKEFKPWKLKLGASRLNQILGIEIPEKKVIEILESLNLNPHVILSEAKNLKKDPSAKPQDDNRVISTTIPTYRNDLQIEEDLIEEVARIYGYNNFPKTLPVGQISTQTIPYYKDHKLDEQVRQILRGCGFSEVYTYSLISEQDLKNEKINPDNVLRVDNPVSREYEFLRPNLAINLKKALAQNIPHAKHINLFEIGKVYRGKSLDEYTENYHLSLISNHKTYREMKGVYEYIFWYLGIEKDMIESPKLQMTENAICIEINYSEIIKQVSKQKTFIPISIYPPIIEDLAFTVNLSVKTGNIIDEIKKQNPLISTVDLLDQYEKTRTFHIVYQHKQRNLTTEEIEKIREKIIKALKDKFSARLKD